MRLLSTHVIMQKLFEKTLPFVKALRLKISSIRPGFFSVMAIDEANLIVPPVNWIPTLFFKYEPNYFGMYASIEERDLTMTAAELLDVFSPAYKHPFIDPQAADEETAQLFKQFQGALSQWSSPTLWANVIETEDGFHFQDELLTWAVEQKLATAGMTKDDAQNLIPFFQNGGWPLQTERTIDGVKVSLRLSEPGENEEYVVT